MMRSCLGAMRYLFLVFALPVCAFVTVDLSAQEQLAAHRVFHFSNSTSQAIPNLCFGSKNGIFAHFSLRSGTQVDRFELEHLSGGVSCSSTALELSSFRCKDVASVAVVCRSGQNNLVTGGFAGITAGEVVVAYNDSHIAASERRLILPAGRTFTENSSCAVVYLPSYLGKGLDYSADVSCFSLTIHMSILPSTQDVSGIWAFPSAVGGGGGWVTSLANRSRVRMSYATDVARLKMGSFELGVGVEGAVFSPGMPSEPAVVLGGLIMRRIQFNAESQSKCTSQANSVSSRDSWELAEALFSTKDVTGGILVRLARVVFFTGNVTSPGSDLYVLFPSSGVMANLSAMDLGQQSDALQSVSHCIELAVAAECSNYHVAPIFAADCEALRSESDCRQVQFCTWGAASRVCCWKHGATKTSNSWQSCGCGYVTESGSFNAQCSPGLGDYTFSNLVTTICLSSTSGIGSTSYSECASQFTERCATNTLGIERMLGYTMDRKCVFGGSTCFDPSLVCSPPTLAPTNSQQTPMPIPNYSVPIDVLVHPIEFDVDDVMAGKAFIHLRVRGETVPINLSAVVSTPLDKLPLIFVAEDVQFGFDAKSTVNLSNARLGTPFDMTLRLGPVLKLRPVTFTQEVIFQPPSNWFYFRLSNAPNITTLTIKMPFPSQNLKNFADYSGIAAILVGLLGGSRAWMGVAMTQTFLAILSSPCSEPVVRYCFSRSNGLSYFVHLLLPNDERYTFSITVTGLISLLILHLLLIFAYVHCRGRALSFRRSLHKLRFPLPFMFCTTAMWFGFTRAAFLGLWEDHGQYIPVMIICAWFVFLCLILAIWYLGIRNGYGGFFEKNKKWEEKPQTCGAWCARIFMTRGRWPDVGAWGTVRALLHERSVYFGSLTLGMVTAHAINCASASSSSYCPAFFWNTFVLQMIHAGFFLLYQPFRVGLLNYLWFVTRLLEIVTSSLLARWVTETDPTAAFTDHIPGLAIATVYLNIVFNLTSLFLIAIEGLPLLFSGRVLEDVEKAEPISIKEMVESDLREPLLLMPEGRVDRNIFIPLRDLVQQKSGQKSVEESERILKNEERRRNDTKRTVIQLRPVPKGYSAEEMLLFFSVFGATDCDIVGETAFIGFRGSVAAAAASTAFHNRTFCGSFVECNVLGEQGLPLDREELMVPPLPIPDQRERHSEDEDGYVLL